MNLPSRLLLPSLLASVALLAACAGGPLGTPATNAPASPETPEPANRLNVITSTTVLADLVRQVGGERVEVRALMPAGRDPHTFEPAPGDAALLAEADLLVMNGLGLDEWLEDLALENAPGVSLVVLGEDLDGVEYLEGSDHGHDEHEDEHGGDNAEEEHDDGFNPHLWLDVANTRLYVERLAGALAANNEGGRESYMGNAAAYARTLAELDGWIRQQIASVPEENRRVVSFHDALPYFGHAYGLEIVGVVVESPGQEPSASELARLVNEVGQANVRAVLAEIQFSDRLARVLAEETDIAVVDQLYTDSLGNPPLDTFEAIMRWNTERIVEALR